VGPTPQPHGPPVGPLKGRAMTGRPALVGIVVLALLSIIGLVGMLLVEGGWDVLFFALAVLPLGVGSVLVGIAKRRQPH